MKQSRLMSLSEAVANVAVGYAVAVAVATQVLVLPQFGLHISIGDSLANGAIFTLVSIARSYAMRRIFERFR